VQEMLAILKRFITSNFLGGSSSYLSCCFVLPLRIPFQKWVLYVLLLSNDVVMKTKILIVHLLFNVNFTNVICVKVFVKVTQSNSSGNSNSRQEN
jgi:hypothetical protein